MDTSFTQGEASGAEAAPPRRFGLGELVPGSSSSSAGCRGSTAESASWRTASDGGLAGRNPAEQGRARKLDEKIEAGRGGEADAR